MWAWVSLHVGAAWLQDVVCGCSVTLYHNDKPSLTWSLTAEFCERTQGAWTFGRLMPNCKVGREESWMQLIRAFVKVSLLIKVVNCVFAARCATHHTTHQ